jgi:hypothetical protein
MEKRTYGIIITTLVRALVLLAIFISFLYWIGVRML